MNQKITINNLRKNMKNIIKVANGLGYFDTVNVDLNDYELAKPNKKIEDDFIVRNKIGEYEFYGHVLDRWNVLNWSSKEDDRSKVSIWNKNTNPNSVWKPKSAIYIGGKRFNLNEYEEINKESLNIPDKKINKNDIVKYVFGVNKTTLYHKATYIAHYSYSEWLKYNSKEYSILVLKDKSYQESMLPLSSLKTNYDINFYDIQSNGYYIGGNNNFASLNDYDNIPINSNYVLNHEDIVYIKQNDTVNGYYTVRYLRMNSYKTVKELNDRFLSSVYNYKECKFYKKKIVPNIKKCYNFILGKYQDLDLNNYAEIKGNIINNKNDIFINDLDEYSVGWNNIFTPDRWKKCNNNNEHCKVLRLKTDQSNDVETPIYIPESLKQFFTKKLFKNNLGVTFLILEVYANSNGIFFYYFENMNIKSVNLKDINFSHNGISI
jgi:hypothetical protein